MSYRRFCIPALLLFAAFSTQAETATPQDPKMDTEMVSDESLVASTELNAEQGEASAAQTALLTPTDGAPESVLSAEGLAQFVFDPQVKNGWSPVCNQGAYCRNDPSVCGPEGFCSPWSWCCMCY